MDLVDRRQFGAGQQRRNRAPAFLVDRFLVVLAAVADIESRQHTGRNTAPPPEESARQARQRVRADHFDLAQSARIQIRSSSIWLPTRNSQSPTSAKP